MTVERLRPYSVNVFAAMSALAAEVGAVNLGQGFPDEDGPTAMLETARRAISDGVNQYPPGPGIAALRHAIAAQRARRYRVDFDPDSEVLVTVGASEAIAAAVLGLVEPGSEVLLIEPWQNTCLKMAPSPKSNMYKLKTSFLIFIELNKQTQKPI
jgi:N-succinyldiaminopimelate aminotransferase